MGAGASAAALRFFVTALLRVGGFFLGNLRLLLRQRQVAVPEPLVRTLQGASVAQLDASVAAQVRRRKGARCLAQPQGLSYNLLHMFPVAQVSTRMLFVRGNSASGGAVLLHIGTIEAELKQISFRS